MIFLTQSYGLDSSVISIDKMSVHWLSQNPRTEIKTTGQVPVCSRPMHQVSHSYFRCTMEQMPTHLYWQHSEAHMHQIVLAQDLLCTWDSPPMVRWPGKAFNCAIVVSNSQLLIANSRGRHPSQICLNCSNDTPSTHLKTGHQNNWSMDTPSKMLQRFVNMMRVRYVQYTSMA